MAGLHSIFYAQPASENFVNTKHSKCADKSKIKWLLKFLFVAAAAAAPERDLVEALDLLLFARSLWHEGVIPNRSCPIYCCKRRRRFSGIRGCTVIVGGQNAAAAEDLLLDFIPPRPSCHVGSGSMR